MKMMEKRFDAMDKVAEGHVSVDDVMRISATRPAA